MLIPIDHIIKVFLFISKTNFTQWYEYKVSHICVVGKRGGGCTWAGR